jgi:hypothetical protein
MTKTILAACCCVAFLSAGCGGGSSGPLTKDQGEDLLLTQVGELCRNYQFGKKKPPAKLTDLQAGSTQGANGYDALKNGKAVLLYNATLPNLNEEPGEGPDDEVLAYMADVPTSGGKVLMLNRTIKTMTADEFKSAKKAGKEVPLPATTKKG